MRPESEIKMNHVFFTVAGQPYALLQGDGRRDLAFVSIRPDGDKIIAEGTEAELAQAVAKLATGAN